MSMTPWTTEKVREFYELPLMDLLFQAQTIHRQHFNANEIELCTLLNIKTGACPEDCGYCSQSGHYKTNVQKENLLSLDEIKKQARIAKENGSTRLCMGAAWRSPPKKDFPKVLDAIKAVKAEGLEACVTLGMLDLEQAQQLKVAGLDFYNHNLDTSPEYYKTVTSTRTYQDRLDTLNCVKDAGLSVCSGGIIGMGETKDDRINLLVELANLPKQPESVPINRLMPIAGTPLGNSEPIPNFEFIRTIAAARILLPKAVIRLSAGRIHMSDEMQALCFFAGANSIWMGDKLLTTQNPESNRDIALFQKLGLEAKIC